MVNSQLNYIINGFIGEVGGYFDEQGFIVIYLAQSLQDFSKLTLFLQFAKIGSIG